MSKPKLGVEQTVTHQIIKTVRDGKEDIRESIICVVRSEMYPSIGQEFSLSVEDAMELNRLLDNKLGSIPR